MGDAAVNSVLLGITSAVPWAIYRLDSPTSSTVEANMVTSGLFTACSLAFSGMANSAMHPSDAIGSPFILTGYVTLDGVNDEPTIGSATAMFGTIDDAEGFSFSCFVRIVVDDGSQHALLSLAGSSNSVLNIILNRNNSVYAAGRIFFNFRDGTTNQVRGRCDFDTGINDGDWHHLVVTFKHSTSTVTVYVDNVVKTFTYNNADTLGSTSNGTVAPVIGSHYTLTGGDPPTANHGNIEIARPALFGDILTADDVEDIYNAALEPEPSFLADAIDDGYPIVIGHVDAPSAGQMVNPAAFIAALRAGWTVAEASAVATPTRNSTWRIIGDPLGTVLFPRQGYEVYSRPLRGSGVGAESDELIAIVPAGVGSVTLDGFGDGTERHVHVRAVSKHGVSDIEPTNSKLRRVIFDGDGDLVPAAPNAPSGVLLTRGASGLVTASFEYLVTRHEAAPATFKVYKALGAAAFDFGSPVATIAYTAGKGRYTQSLGTHSDGVIVRVIIGAVSAGGGEARSIEQQITADAAAPDAPASITAEVSA